jgi:cytochrome c oxidase assembly factor CtaG
VDPKLNGHQATAPLQARWRSWLWPAGVALILACLLPPLIGLARRYLFVESIQFCVFAMAGPALIVLGAPWRVVRLPGGAAGLVDRLAGGRRDRASVVPAAGYLVAWVVICLGWRLVPVLDTLARHPALVVAEMLTLCAAGTLLWLELVHSPPLVPRLAHPQRACVAALAMWSIWAIAYVLGFATHSVVPAYDGVGRSLSPVADQEITAFLLWAVAGLCFIPVIFATLLTWLKEGAEAAREPDGPTARAGVRGWGGSARQGRRRHVGSQ